jgi:hypothetical protein
VSQAETGHGDYAAPFVRVVRRHDVGDAKKGTDHAVVVHWVVGTDERSMDVSIN